MKQILVASAITVLLVATFGVVSSVGAVEPSLQEGVRITEGTGVPTDLTGEGGLITDIVNILLFIVGIVSVVMLIIGGLRYVVSGGNSTTVTAAKNTILYAIVGLLIAVFAYAIINFVLAAIMGDGFSGFGSGPAGNSSSDIGGNNVQPTNR